jgi:hypothetical protein
MILVTTQMGYNFWKGTNKKGDSYYNVTPCEQKKPNGGYMSSDYICKIKNVPNFFI